MESTIYTVDGKAFELQHYGVKGMKWGRRRYQNKDGSLTEAGKKRLAKSIQKAANDDNTYAGRKRLQQDIYDDLMTNYSGQMTKHVQNIRAAKKRYADSWSRKEPYGSDDAWENYVKACRSAVDDILGQYGELPVSQDRNSYEFKPQVSKVVTRALLYKDFDGID